MMAFGENRQCMQRLMFEPAMEAPIERGALHGETPERAQPPLLLALELRAAPAACTLQLMALPQDAEGGHERRSHGR